MVVHHDLYVSKSFPSFSTTGQGLKPTIVCIIEICCLNDKYSVKSWASLSNSWK
jgi:hypothetical protein